MATGKTLNSNRRDAKKRLHSKIALTVRCPRCGRPPDNPCRGWEGDPILPHMDRVNRALEIEETTNAH